MHEITLAAPEDFPRVRALFHSLIDEMQHPPTFPYWEKDVYPTDETVHGYIARGEMHLLTVGGELAGTVSLCRTFRDGDGADWLTVRPDSDFAVIALLAVHPRFARRGYAKVLLNHALGLARSANLRSVRLDVTDNNLPAQRLYEGAGFSPAGESTSVFDDGSSIRFLFYELAL